MAEFSVKDKSKLDRAASDMISKASTVSSVYSTVASVRSNYAIHDGSYAGVRNSLQSCMTDINNEMIHLKSLGLNLQQIGSQYETTENKILVNAGVKAKKSSAKSGTNYGPAISQGNNSGGSSNNSGSSEQSASQSEESQKKKNWKDYLTEGVIEGIGGAGIIGGGISSIASFINSDKEASDWWDLADGTISTGADIFEFAKKSDRSWKDLLGLGKALEEIDTSTVSSTFKGVIDDEIKGFSWKAAETVGEKASVIASWAGVAISGITNGIENYDEYKSGSISADRAVTETVIETAVDVGLDIAATAAISAGAVALGIAGAPAVVVGATAAVVVWGANELVEGLTGKDIGEHVADAYCDYQEAKREFLTHPVESVKNGIASIGNAFAAWAS